MVGRDLLRQGGLRVRIGRLVLPGVAPADAARVEAALRSELARLAPTLTSPAHHSNARNTAGPLTATTPAGQGREAAGRIVAHIGASIGPRR